MPLFRSMEQLDIEKRKKLIVAFSIKELNAT
jgi:hypothetical protein